MNKIPVNRIKGKGHFLLEINGQYDRDQDDLEASTFKYEGSQAQPL